MAHNIALIGFGGVGRGFVDILRQKKETLERGVGIRINIVSICDIQKGSIHRDEGLDLDTIVDVMNTTGQLEDYPDRPGLIKGWDSLTTIRHSNADTIVEITYTDVNTGQPALEHCRSAFRQGKNVVMSNKGPIALAYAELFQLAQRNHVQWKFEGTVMSGTPALRMPLVSLSGNEIREIRGILNGTTNYILTQMEAGMSFHESVEKAQQQGYAEADPTSDVDGYDALYKIVILANVIMGIPLRPEDVYCQGIRHLTMADMKQAKLEGKRWKLIGKVQRDGRQVTASVAPEKVPEYDPLSGVSGAMNAITYDCDLSGPITLIGAGAGLVETGYSLLIDLINIERQQL